MSENDLQEDGKPGPCAGVGGRKTQKNRNDFGSAGLLRIPRAGGKDEQGGYAPRKRTQRKIAPVRNVK